MLSAAQAGVLRALAPRLYDRADDLDPSTTVAPAQLFSALSIWNQPKVYRTAQTVGIPNSPNLGWSPIIASSSLSSGIWVAGPHDRPMILYPDPTTGTIGNETTGFVAPAPILGPRWPRGVVPAPGGDGAAVILDGDQGTDFYGLAFDGSRWTAKNIATWSVSGSGLGTPTAAAGVRAAGTSFAAGLIRTTELQSVSGPFPHMLAMAVGQHVIGRGPVAPVFSEDTLNLPYSGSWCRMGSIAMINPSLDLRVFTDPGIRRVAMTLQTFGAMVVDTCDYTPFTFYAEQGSGFDRNYDDRVQLGILQQAMRVIQ